MLHESPFHSNRTEVMIEFDKTNYSPWNTVTGYVTINVANPRVHNFQTRNIYFKSMKRVSFMNLVYVKTNKDTKSIIR